MTTKRRMAALLPPTPCTKEMRERLVEVAGKQGKSIAQIQREAVTLFLSRFYTESIEKCPSCIEGQS